MKNPECSCDRRFLYGKELYNAVDLLWFLPQKRAKERVGWGQLPESLIERE